jgi:hypothetical protein
VLTAAFLISVWLPLTLGEPPEFLRDYQEASVPTGRLYSRGWSEKDRVVVAEFLPGALAKSEAVLGRSLGAPFTTILVPHRQELDRVVGALGATLPFSDTVLGVAFPRLRVLVVRDGLLPGTGPFRETLTHEVAHLVLHRLADARIPKWFDEGVAMWVSGTALKPSEESYLSFLARIGGLYPLAKLEYRFPPTHQLTSIAYQQSLLLVTYLVELQGSRVLAELLGRFEAGESTRDALREVTGVDLDALDEAFGAWVVARRSLLAAAASIINLWTLTAVLALVAIGVHWVRRRRRFRELARAELADSEALTGHEDSLA